MKLKFYLPRIFGLLFLWSTISVFSQSASPDKVITPLGFDKSEKLSNVNVIPPVSHDPSWKDAVLPINDEFDNELTTPISWAGPDPELQEEMSRSTNATDAGTTPATVYQNFEGVPIDLSQGGGLVPPHPNGDVGPDHYMQMVNNRFEIFDKNGNSLVGPAFNVTLWDGFTGPWTDNIVSNDRTPNVLYDEYADRWIASQLSMPNFPDGPFYELIAVSQTGDPTGAWYRYAYEFVNMLTANKFGVWPDGYYFTTDFFAPGNGPYVETGVCVLDRTAMIAGDPTASLIMFTTQYRGLLPSDADGATLPPTGSPAYMMSLETDHLRMWEVDVDWVTPSNSSMTYTTSLTMDPYSTSSSIDQPGTTTTLHSHSDRLMYRLQYRNFGTHEVMLTNHTVDADGNGLAGVRWYEIRNTGGGWNIYQQGTFAPADGDARWVGSIAMNGNGDIAVGYSVGSSTTYPSIRIAGQTAANSGTGILDVNETSIFEGYASQTESPSWGGFSMMTVDPSDDETFWYTNEFSTGRFFWHTQIASFTFAPYCSSYGNSTAREWIQTIDLGTYTNNSGDNGGYLDNTINAVSVESGQSYAFKGTPGFSNRSRREYWRVWIDFNNDGDFTDSGEEVFAANAKKGPVNGSISIPSGLTGDTRMRVSMKYKAAPGPCEQFTYGEVEDYKLLFTTPVPLPPVADFEGTPTTVTAGNSVDFTDLSLNNPTSWAWTFAGGTPASSTAQNPTVTYDTEGTYAVSLTATNDVGSDTKTVANYITVVAGSGCTPVSNNFPINPLTHSGQGSSSTTYDFGTPGNTDVSFVVSGLDAKINGKPNNRYIDLVTVTYTDAGGAQTYGTFSGANTSSANVNIAGPVYSVTVTLEDGYDGNPPGTLSVNLGSISSCLPGVTLPGGNDLTDDGFDRNIAEFLVYPNPTSNVLNIDLGTAREMKDGMISLINILGNVITTVKVTEGSKNIRINTSGVAPGLYWVQLVEANRFIAARKVVIKR